jgi:signal transduction histidine kinase/ActR/RegA family two-component response regulator
MKIRKIGVFVVYLLLAGVTSVYSNNFASIHIFESDSITSVDERIEYLIKISTELKKNSLPLSLDAINFALKLSTENDNKFLLAKCEYEKGIILSKTKDVDEALQLLKKAMGYYEGKSDDAQTAMILVDIGNVYLFNNQFEKSIMYYNSALAEFAKHADSLNIVVCNTYLGQAHAALGNSEEAVNFFTKAIRISKQRKFDYYLADNYLKLSKLKLSKGQFDSVLHTKNIALNIAKNEHYNNLIADAYLLTADYYYTIDSTAKASLQLSNFIRFTDSVNILNSEQFAVYLHEISKGKSSPNNESETGFAFWMLLIISIIVFLYLIYKIVNQNSRFKNQLYIITSELDAFKEQSIDINETVENITNQRINEFESQVNENKDVKIILSDSLSNLNNVNNLKDIFLSKISHEIRTPLSGILGFSEILETELALLEYSTLYEFANSISQSGQSLVSLLNNILDISRLDSNNMNLEFKKANTKELIQGVVDSYFQEASLKGVKLIYAPESVSHIYTDIHLFIKIISLVLDNSVKFTERGFVKISNYLDEKTGMIIILIKDTGIGIDKVYVNQVFEPFRQESLGYSTSYQGAGLGLPLAKKMSLKLNGDIELESEKGSGTTITLRFPAFTDKIEAKVKTEGSKFMTKLTENPWDKLSVLVVEDDNMNQILYRKLLKKARFLEIAKDGKTALSVVEKQNVNNNFQLVLMDINLPAPWDGISLMKKIRSKWPEYKNIPFIAQTAYAISGNRDVMLEEGFDEYITKPIIKSVLVDAINKVV